MIRHDDTVNTPHLILDVELQSQALQSFPKFLCVLPVSPPARLQALGVWCWSPVATQNAKYIGVCGSLADLFSHNSKGFPQSIEVCNRPSVVVTAESKSYSEDVATVSHGVGFTLALLRPPPSISTASSCRSRTTSLHSFSLTS